jgi:hypothetical protein
VGNQDRKLEGHTSSNMAYCEIPHIEGWTNATTAIRGPLRPVFYPNKKVNVIANYLENLFTPHKVCDTDHEWWVEARVQALLTIVDENPPS